jgi:hypothetical protein
MKRFTETSLGLNPIWDDSQLRTRCLGIFFPGVAMSIASGGIWRFRRGPHLTKVCAVSSSGTEGEVHSAVQPTRLRGSDATRLHLTLAGGLVLCIGAFVIELMRALGGHAFSWMYVFEWPLFAGFAIYMWWNLLQGNDRVARASRQKRTPLTGDASDEGLDEWNLYLQVMEAAEGDDPGRPA